jgi:hypothetical protein
MAPRIDRKLAAILAADVVGYSRLVGIDEAGTIGCLKRLRKELIEPLISEYHGRIVKLMGDGALVEFASAVDAVECAVAVQHGVAEREDSRPEDRRIEFRVGINIGDIIVENGDIYGDGVNIAARLEGLAEPGGICLSRNVYNQVKAKLDLALEPMGEHRVPREPERAGSRSAPPTGLGTAPLAGGGRGGCVGPGPRRRRDVVRAPSRGLARRFTRGGRAGSRCSEGEARIAAAGQAIHRGAAVREPLG